MRFRHILGGAPLALLIAAASPAGAAPASYPTTEAAVGAVIAALEARDRAALVQVFGAENEDVVFTGDQAVSYTHLTLPTN